VTAVSPRKARRLPDNLARRGRGGTGRGGAGRSGRGVPAAGAGDPSPRLGPPVQESWQGQDWVVRLVPGGAAVKGYRCPGCDQEIPPGTPHLVAWPALTPGLSERRHWHRPCWEQRSHRAPGIRRGR
jgi:hypothetical protein